jgi:hypothetical protein
VAMTCTPTDNLDNINEWNARMLAKFTVPGGMGLASCGMTAGGHYPIGIATAAKTTVLADVFTSHEPSPGFTSLFKDAKIHVAIYEDVRWQDYPFPPRPADLNTSPEYAWWSGPDLVRVAGPKTAQEANKPLTFTQPFDPKLMFNLETRGPGRARVLINGKEISPQAGDSMLAQDNLISFWGYTKSGFNIPLDPASFASNGLGTAGPTTKPGAPLTVTIVPQDFQGPDWRVVQVQNGAPNRVDLMITPR